MATISSRLKYIIGSDVKGFLSGIQQSQRQLVGFQKNIASFTKFAAAGFGGIEIGRILLDSSRIAEQARGIKLAFNALDNPNLLNNLRESVRDTVSDFDLMRQAVRASNFKIPIERLGTFFEFARQRAAATGESVDYLVNSIIDGIGRKSTLVLDNLGISASELQEEIRLVGDFGQAAANIIEREMRNAAEGIDDVVNSTDKLSAAFENFKLSLGENTSGALQSINNFVAGALKALSNKELQDALFRLIPGVATLQADQRARAARASSIAGGASSLGGSVNSPFRIDNKGLSDVSKLRGDLLQIQLITARLRNASLQSLVPPQVLERIANAEERLQRVKSLFDASIGAGFSSDSLNAIGRLDADLLQRFQGIAPQAESLNEVLRQTNQITSVLTTSFQQLFRTILDGGASAEDIFKELAASLASGLFNVATGGLFGAIGNAIGASPGSVVLSSGDIKLSSTLEARNRGFSGI